LLPKTHDNLWSTNPEADYRHVYLAPDGSAVDRNTLLNDYDDKLLSVVVTPTGTYWSDIDYSDLYPDEEPPNPNPNPEPEPSDEYQCDGYH